MTPALRGCCQRTDIAPTPALPVTSLGGARSTFAAPHTTAIRTRPLVAPRIRFGGNTRTSVRLSNAGALRTARATETARARASLTSDPVALGRTMGVIVTRESTDSGGTATSRAMTRRCAAVVAIRLPGNRMVVARVPDSVCEAIVKAAELCGVTATTGEAASGIAAVGTATLTAAMRDRATNHARLVAATRNTVMSVHNPRKRSQHPPNGGVSRFAETVCATRRAPILTPQSLEVG